jgi:hypothetical protein
MQVEGENSAVDSLGSSATGKVTTRLSYKHVPADPGHVEGEARVPAVIIRFSNIYPGSNTTLQTLPRVWKYMPTYTIHLYV